MEPKEKKTNLELAMDKLTHYEKGLVLAWQVSALTRAISINETEESADRTYDVLMGIMRDNNGYDPTLCRSVRKALITHGGVPILVRDGENYMPKYTMFLTGSSEFTIGKHRKGSIDVNDFEKATVFKYDGNYDITSETEKG